MTPTAPTLSLSITKNPMLDSIINKVLFAAALALATLAISHLKLANLGVDPAMLAQAIFGVLGTIAMLIYGALVARQHQTVAVQAGVNLKASGSSILIPSTQVPGQLTDQPVTPATAAEIVRDFKDVHVAVTEEAAETARLNATQSVIKKG